MPLVLNLMLFLCLETYIEAFPTEALHDYMTNEELAFYFQTIDKHSVPDYEIVYLPVILPTKEAVSDDDEQAQEIDLNFHAFKRPVNLKLKENKHITRPDFKTYVREDGHIAELLQPTLGCHFLHRDQNQVAAISVCEPKSMQGFIFLENSTLELHPITHRLKDLIRNQEPSLQDLPFKNEMDESVPYIVKRAAKIKPTFVNDAFVIPENFIGQHTIMKRNIDDEIDNFIDSLQVKKYGTSRKLTAEVALFFDEPGYKIFAPYMDYDDKKLQDMLLAYINGVQALYHHPSLGVSLDIVLVRLDIFKKQPPEMPHYNGERNELLSSFCNYQSSINPPNDEDPEHWDMALYVSGLDFYAYENGKRSGATMGLATVGGVCLDKYNCVIAELGTTNVFGKPYPSAGFTSVYVLAHEMGHNFGMHHDGKGNNCPKEGYIMSPSRGTNGETQWSACSADIMSNIGSNTCLVDSGKSTNGLDHNRFLENPGQMYTAKKQCEILLRDKDATVAPNQKLSSICYSLQCKTPHRSGYYLSGPALEGTQCGKGQYCSDGNCETKTLPKPIKVVPGGWGPLKPGTCTSGCIENSLGYQVNRRFCNNPKPVNTDKGCDGSSVLFTLCADKDLCKEKVSPVDYASKKCKKFSDLLPELDPKGAGLQAPHEELRLWMGCAIFCKRADSPTYYTPRIELNDLGASPYFPDGTWCHKANGIDYYCRQHHCLPENFQFTKLSDIPNYLGEDMPLSQNAHPFPLVPPSLKEYLSLSPDGKPLQKILKPSDVIPKEDWESDDYIEMPRSLSNIKRF